MPKTFPGPPAPKPGTPATIAILKTSGRLPPAVLQGDLLLPVLLPRNLLPGQGKLFKTKLTA